MAQRMVHRGPDEGHVHVDPDHGVSIGARRLSIIDVEGGQQPLCNEDRTVWAALNGEIYNYPQLRRELMARGHSLASRCDTEVLVHLYEDFGPDLVHALDGMFAFVVWDNRRKEILLARDRFGEKPLFYDTTDGELSFASELSALQAVGDRGPVDPLAVQAVMTLGYVPGPRTMRDRVQQVPAAHVLRWPLDELRPTINKYWEMPASTTLQGTHGGLVDEAEDLLDRSVSGRLVADVPVGVLLSGGLDSTLVAALARRHTSELKTFTVSYDSGAVNEDAPARASAELLHSDHHELQITSSWVAEHVPGLLTALDQPIADPAFVALSALSRFAREQVKVVVGGEGADELFFGYPRYRWLARAERLGRIVPPRGARTIAGVALKVSSDRRTRRVAEVLEPASSFERNLRWLTQEGQTGRSALYGARLQEQVDGGELHDLVSERWPGATEPAVAAARLDQRLYLCDDILQKADRASMAASLEMRTPYLDRTLAEFSTTVAPEVHLAGGGKNLLREVLRRALPPAGRGRKKTAFRVPLADWLRGPLAGAVDEHVVQGRLVADGWIQHSAGTKLVAQLTAQDAAADVLWPLLCVGAWLDGQS